MHRHFEEQIAECRERLVRMGTIAEQMIDKAIKCLVDRKTDDHATVNAHEAEVNELQIEIDERVVNLLALQHPVAADLRLVIMCTKIAGELERVADQAVNICQNTVVLLQHPPLKPLIDIPLMADIARAMLKDSLDSFVKQDVDLARRILKEDDKVDAFKNQIFRELLTYMMSEPVTIPRALPLILISRNLERVGDHATNIAEEVIYVVQGRDVRHHHEETKRHAANDPDHR
jgi:phosphate transport system protein